VEDLDAILAAVVANGGRITMPKAPIPTVGVLVRFDDPEGNDIGAMAYEHQPVTR
jgi:predicted enzyme related to lactoylglutathione lyase